MQADTHTDGRTNEEVDIMKLIVIFRKIVNVPKNGKDCIILFEIKIMFHQNIPIQECGVYQLKKCYKYAYRLI
jgi:hypothetical protein